MKKFIYAMAAFLTLGLAACSDSDDDKDLTTGSGETTEDVIYSFTYRNATMSETAKAEVSLLKGDGSSSYTANKDLSFPFEINTEKSTAVEGTHYNFDGEKVITVPRGKSSGTIKLNLLQKEDEKDIIVLKLQSPGEHFLLGSFDEITIKIVGESIEILKGTWKFSQWDNKDYYGLTYDLSKFPQIAANNEDIIIINDEGFLPDLKSDLKNYFTGNSGMQYIGERVFRFMDDISIRRTAAIFSLNNINANFSATSTTPKASRVAMSVIKDENNDDVLEMIIYSYEPTDFLVEEYNAMKEYADEDYPAMDGYPLRYHFKRVQ